MEAKAFPLVFHGRETRSKSPISHVAAVTCEDSEIFKKSGSRSKSAVRGRGFPRLFSSVRVGNSGRASAQMIKSCCGGQVRKKLLAVTLPDDRHRQRDYGIANEAHPLKRKICIQYLYTLLDSFYLEMKRTEEEGGVYEREKQWHEWAL